MFPDDCEMCNPSTFRRRLAQALVAKRRVKERSSTATWPASAAMTLVAKDRWASMGGARYRLHHTCYGRGLRNSCSGPYLYASTPTWPLWMPRRVQAGLPFERAVEASNPRCGRRCASARRRGLGRLRHAPPSRWHSKRRSAPTPAGCTRSGRHCHGLRGQPRNPGKPSDATGLSAEWST
jgi:hypothetical protein